MTEKSAQKCGYTSSFDGQLFNLEVSTLHLISIILADKELKKLYSKYDLKYMEPFIEDIKESEILKLLLDIATQYRIIEWNIPKEKTSKINAEIVGTLEDIKNKYETELTIKEACNKIIHANEFVFDITKLKGKQYFYYNPYIYIYGKKGKVDWKASIDLVLFCNAVNQNLDPIF